MSTPWLRLLSVVTVVALAAFVIGCGSDHSTASSSQTQTTTTAKTSNALPDLHGKTISYVGFGGSLDEAFKKAWFDPFSKATGVKISLDSPTDYTKIKTQVNSGNVQWDLVDGEPFFIGPGCGKLFEPLNVDTSAVKPQFQLPDKCEVPETIYNAHMVYLDKAFPNGGPQNCKDFFDTTKFPGKRGLFSYAEAGFLECAAIAAGANPENPYPIDIDKAFKVLDSIKKDVVIYPSATQSQDMLENGDIAACICLSRAFAPAITNGTKMHVIAKPNFRSEGGFAIPKGAPNKEAAEALLNYIMKPENNARAQKYLIYGVPTGADPNLAPPDLREWMATGPKVNAGAVDIDNKWWSAHAPEVFERWGEYTTK